MNASSSDFGLPLTQEPKYTIDQNGRIINRETEAAIPDDEPIMIFRARDTHAATAIAFYSNICHDPQHRAIVNQRFVEFQRFAAEHPERMKEPDSPR